MGKRRYWQRLSVYISLAAFLIANTHASQCLAAHEDSECCHCSCSELQSDDADALHAPEHGDGPHGPYCPEDSKCPCPGGCALCNVAKVPHTAPLLGPPCSITCLGTRLPDPSSLYTAPFSGRLIRPPRF